MNVVQRAWRSVIRKPVKSVLLLLVIFTVNIFLMAGMASKNASIDSQDKTRQAIGAGIQIEQNEANRKKRMDELAEQMSDQIDKLGDGEEVSLGGYHVSKRETSSGPQYSSWSDNFFETLKLEDIVKLAGVQGVADYNITTLNTRVNPVNFNRIEDPDNDQSEDVGAVTLLGNREMELDSNVLSGNVTIKEGRMAGPDDENVCIISEELAALNNLKLGDVLEFNSHTDKEGSDVHKAKIIGIYSVQKKMTAIMSGDTYRSENVIFTDLRFPEKAEGKEGNPLFMKAYFQVENVDDYETVKERLMQADIDWERYDLIDNNGNLMTMATNFSNLESVSMMLIGVIIAASFLILFLIFVFWMKNRTKEIGVFLSMGITKGSVLGQIILEAYMIAAAAFLLSFVAAPAVSQAAAEYLVEQQVQQEEEQKLLDEGKVGGEFIEPDLNVTGVKIEINGTIAAATVAGVLGLISCGVAAAGVTVVRRKPKQILSEMS